MLDRSSASKPTANIPGKLILVVEDDEEIGHLLAQIIHQETTYQVIHHINARNALNAITRRTPHLFILDYSLPDMNGIELHDWLQSFPHLKHSPTILMSAWNPPLQEISKRGIFFINKPFAVTELLTTIENLLA
ncbi:MAG TPA: response regulator [Ktedonobacteraceae bacterium]|nr:response regulator [Ktedonobacteraceae bacterium]